MNNIIKQIDFYILPQADYTACHDFVCKLVEKAYQQQYKITIQTALADDAQALDHYLWSYRAESFVPHSITDHDATQIVIEGLQKQPLNCFINLTVNPNLSDNWHRLLQIIPNNDNLKQQGRQLYQLYRQQGLIANVHQIKG